jgi:ribosomal protein S18 acetylase RimI-like enzyme
MLKVIEENQTFSLRDDSNGLKLLCSLVAKVEDKYEKRKYIPEYIDKKVLYITSFTTIYKFRNMGYATYLLKEIISRFRDKFDLIHLNACPYYFNNGSTVFEAPDNGLDMDRLIKFYESFGFKVYGTTEEGFKVMILK